uniref:Uncharacterized protein n=1 Tax=Tanacetum cinerariifolium TaxID=118510 RepID=A0A6L2KCY7_TANCI|nr:hypothetical protein [Tanacetum cinerariifolium]
MFNVLAAGSVFRGWKMKRIRLASNRLVVDWLLENVIWKTGLKMWQFKQLSVSDSICAMFYYQLSRSSRKGVQVCDSVSSGTLPEGYRWKDRHGIEKILCLVANSLVQDFMLIKVVFGFLLVCVDTSSWMESTKSPMFEEQAEAIIHCCKNKFDSHEQNVVGLCGMGDAFLNHMIYPTRILSKIIAAINACDMEVLGRGTKVLYNDGDEDVLNLNQRQTDIAWRCVCH